MFEDTVEVFSQPSVRYELVEQFVQEGRVRIVDRWQSDKPTYVVSVTSLACQRDIMDQFKGSHACTIGHIYANATSTVVVES